MSDTAIAKQRVRGGLLPLGASQTMSRSSSRDNRTLADLIKRLKEDDKGPRKLTAKVRHPKLLIKTLEDFDAVIGNRKVKDSIAAQLTHLVSQEGAEFKRQDVILNSLLCGPPGVGKTTVGIHISRIWYSLGYLNGGKTQKVKKRSSSEVDYSAGFSLLISAVIWTLIIAVLLLGIFPEYRRAILFVAGLALLVIGGGLVYNLYSIWQLSQAETPASNGDQAAGHKDGRDMPSDDDILRVVSRDDLVGEYVGHSGPKTQALLESCRGKVLFVDEAYTVCQSSRDSFGMEALTTLTKFMSENPNDIIVIFAGYRGHLEKGPLRLQPGLRRRFLFSFECEGYTHSELYQIFKLQVQKMGNRIEDENQMKRFFRDHYRDFPNYGGDTGSLAFMAGTENSADVVYEGGTRGLLTIDQVSRGLTTMKANRLEREPEDDPEPVDLQAQLMQALRQHA